MKHDLILPSICSAVGAVGGAITTLCGGWSTDLITLIILMAVDFGLGLLIALIWQKSDKSENGGLESRACFKGLVRKCAMLLFVMVAVRLDMLLGTSYIRAAVIIGFITNELISIVENAAIIGLPLPGVVKKSIEVLKNKSGDDDDVDT